MTQRIFRATSTLLATLLLGTGAALLSPTTSQALSINTDFEGSNLGDWEEVEPGVLDVTIRRDTASRGFRWYSFRVEGAEGRELTVNITNAGSASASAPWSFNQPVLSGDGGETWDRISDSRYEGGVFSFTWTVQSDSDWVALVPPYSFQRWLDLVSEVSTDPRVGSEIIGESLQGRPVHMLTVTSGDTPPEEKPAVWVTARVHPAETGSSWQTEGLVEWLLSDDPQASGLLEQSTFYIVGVLNPDGVVLGNYRMDTLGQNLNREWDNDDPAKAPTIIATKERMQSFVEAGGEILAFFDLHSHSSVRANFVYFNDSPSIPADEMGDLLDMLLLHEEISDGEFSMEYSTGSNPSTRGIAKNWAFLTLGIPAVTYETSYQDILHGDGGFMTVDRYKNLGRDLGRTVAKHFFDLPLTEVESAQPVLVGE
ncbi:MAG: hypothetical protein JJU11_02785 [Candidatus Sumerlaeia bacterium]|nr:hypothetical protein [Candidatus Sumerlaeia bacterium]